MADFDIYNQGDTARRLPTRNLRGYVFMAEKVGQWDLAKAFFKKLPLEVKMATHSAQKAFAKLYLKEIRRAIDNNGGSNYNWAPLKPGTIYTKALYNAVDAANIYKFMGNYYRSIEVIENPAAFSVNVGFPLNSDRSFLMASDFSLSQRAYILEHGIPGRVPARPLWRPAFKAVGGTAMMATLVAKELTKIKML